MKIPTDIFRNLSETPVSSCPNVERVDHFANSLVFRTFVCLSLTPQTLLAVNIPSCWILLRVANSAYVADETPIEDIEDKDVDNLAVVDLSGGRRNPMEGGGGGVGGAIASPLKAFTFVVLLLSVSFVSSEFLIVWPAAPFQFMKLWSDHSLCYAWADR